MADETPNSGQQPANTDAPLTDDGKIDFSKLPKPVQELFNRLLEDKQQANREAQAAKGRNKELETAKEKAEREALE